MQIHFCPFLFLLSRDFHNAKHILVFHPWIVVKIGVSVGRGGWNFIFAILLTFHLSRSSKIFQWHFHWQVVYISFTFHCRSITLLLFYSLKNFSFDAIANESVVLTLYLDCSLLMYTSSTDIYIIDPLSLTLLSSFIGSNIFQWVPEHFLHTRSSHLHIAIASPLYFPSYATYPIFFLSCPKTCSTILPRSGKSKSK